MEPEHNKYSLAEKERVGEIVEKFKIIYDKEKEEKDKAALKWDRRRKKYVTPGVTWGYLAKAVKTA